jgi:hypothetical protein
MRHSSSAQFWPRNGYRIILAGLLLLTAAVYWPSLYGGFLFDDRNIVQSADLHVTTLSLGDWVRAALSQAGTNQFRALGMLSFAANYYFSGVDPFWLKLTNVAIHLLNGMLLFLVLRELLQLWSQTRTAQQTINWTNADNLPLIAAAAAGAWLLLPINLTAVAYVSQRLESLANAFVLLGLYWYLRVRRRHYDDAPGAMLLVALLACMLLGFSAKESAVLLPLYAFCIEFAITKFRNRDGRVSRPVVWTHAAVLSVPLLAGLFWIGTWVFRSIAAYRPFSIGERLLTEPRVLVDYIAWTLLPNLNWLTFYHDDLKPSHGILDPPTTLLAILALLALLGIAFWQRKARPLFCLGILWFFAGHALTATVIPLELVFEHRNYFPSIGLLLAAASLIALEPGLKLPLARYLISAALLTFFAFTTTLRSMEWSHPLRFAHSEALKRPDSPRAQYEFALTLIEAAGKDEKSPLVEESIKVLEQNAFRPDSGIAPLQALIYINGRAHRDIDPRLWHEIIAKIGARTPSQTDIESIAFLLHCQLDGDCPLQPRELLAVFLAALDRADGNVYLMSAYAEFALRELGDTDLAVRISRDVVALKPQVPVYRANLVKFLIATGRFGEAQDAIIGLAAMNHLNMLDPMLADLNGRLVAARDAQARKSSEERDDD